MNLADFLQKQHGMKAVERGDGYTVLTKDAGADRGEVVWDDLERTRPVRRVNGVWGRVRSNIQGGQKTLPGHEGDRVFYPLDGSGATPLD